MEGVTPRGTQNLLLVLHSRITSSRIGGPNGCQGSNPGKKWVWQTPFLLYSLSTPEMETLKCKLINKKRDFHIKQILLLNNQRKRMSLFFWKNLELIFVDETEQKRNYRFNYKCMSFWSVEGLCSLVWTT